MKTTPSAFLRLQRLLSVAVLLALVFSLSTCAKRARSRQPIAKANDQQSGSPPQAVASGDQTSARRININTAPESELEQLPGIGKGLAERIVEHREKYGLFRRPEHLIMVRGISDRRFRALRDLITVQ